MNALRAIATSACSCLGNAGRSLLVAHHYSDTPRKSFRIIAVIIRFVTSVKQCVRGRLWNCRLAHTCLREGLVRVRSTTWISRWIVLYETGHRLLVFPKGCSIRLGYLQSGALPTLPCSCNKRRRGAYSYRARVCTNVCNQGCGVGVGRTFRWSWSRKEF
jgi:hypothetical protein